MTKHKAAPCCGLLFSATRVHDQLLRMEDDPAVLGEVFLAAADLASSASELFEVCGYDHFVAAHEWRDRRTMVDLGPAVAALQRRGRDLNRLRERVAMARSVLGPA